MILAVFVTLFVAYLIINNNDLRKQNNGLFIDNAHLFSKKTDLEWQLSTTKSELKQLKAEFGVNQTIKIKVRDESHRVAKNQHFADTK